MNGTTIHGAQRWVDGQGGEPLAYYHRTGPAGQLFAALGEDARPRSVAVVGLGSGALAAYGREGDSLTAFEIDPVVVRIARDETLFTFLRDAKAKVRVVVADGRLGVADEPPRSFDLIILDAFGSDAPPVHLLTREAMEMYRSKLRPGGLLLAQVSNRYLALERALARVAGEIGMVAVQQWDAGLDGLQAGDKEPSRWVVLAQSTGDLDTLTVDPRWVVLDPDPSAPLWTDDFSDLLSVVR